MVDFGPDITSTANAIHQYSSRYPFSCAYPGSGGSAAWASTNIINAFDNNIVSSGTYDTAKNWWWYSMIVQGLIFYSWAAGAPGMFGQNFGVDNKKHIRKIRYQYAHNVSSVNIRASNSSSWSSSYVTILSNQSVVQKDFGWNEIILPSSQHYQYWLIHLVGYGAEGYYDPPAIGEIEMMQALPSPISQAYIL